MKKIKRSEAGRVIDGEYETVNAGTVIKVASGVHGVEETTWLEAAVIPDLPKNGKGGKGVKVERSSAGDVVRLSGSLTDRIVAALPFAPAGLEYSVFDELLTGLTIRVRETKRSYVIRKRSPFGSRFNIGDAAGMDVETAREEGQAILRDILRGLNPLKRREERKRQEEAKIKNTVAAVAKEYLESDYLAPLRTAHETTRIVNKEIVGRWGSELIADITDDHVHAAITDITHRIRKRANTRLKVVADPHEDEISLAKRAGQQSARAFCSEGSRFFGWAKAKKFVDSNPFDEIKISKVVGKKQDRERCLEDHEVAALWKACDALQYPVGTFTKLLLMTGARLSEVTEARWTEFDMDKKTWTIPPARTKTEIYHVIPLTDEIIEIINNIPRSKSEFLFPSRIADDRPINGYSKFKRRLDEAMMKALKADGHHGKIAPWRFHDLRRVFRSNLSALPISSNVSELLLGHKIKGVQGIYDRYKYLDEKRQAMALWMARLMLIVEPKGDNVVTLLRSKK
jgi:integrase